MWPRYSFDWWMVLASLIMLVITILYFGVKVIFDPVDLGLWSVIRAEILTLHWPDWRGTREYEWVCEKLHASGHSDWRLYERQVDVKCREPRDRWIRLVGRTSLGTRTYMFCEPGRSPKDTLGGMV